MNRVQNTKLVLWVLTGLAAAVGLTRFLFGLGATTNLSDATPWGLWIGFDVMGGVALAGGGFVLTAAFYIFKGEKFHALTRPAVLTAFLGYLAVIFGLMFDLGLPWNIWHMMIYWNVHSPLFEVGWCVMLYTTVLLLEFSPIPLEEASRYARIRGVLLRLRFPLVLLGIMLSTLHQSSLGSLFLIMPYKVHALWYSATLPVQFFISAVALGLAMVTLESLVSHWLYRRQPETDCTTGLVKAAMWVLVVYLVVKLADVTLAGELALLFSGAWESNLFLFELLISTLVPLVLFAIPSVRSRAGGQLIGASLVVFGVVLNRLNVGGLSMLRATGDNYVPSWMEVVISLGVVAAAGLAFLFAVERFNIWERRPVHPESSPHARPGFDYASRVWLGSPSLTARTKYSLAFVLSFALGFALMPHSKVQGKGVKLIPAQKARGGDVLVIDGNRDSFGSRFDHAMMIDRLGKEESCIKCHHMNLPLDRQSGCWECHGSMYTTTDVFDHDWHAAPDGARLACDQCHTEGEERGRASAKTCRDCHKDLYAGAAVAADQDPEEVTYIAMSYVDAMHDQCIGCHRQVAAEDSSKASLTECANCHGGVQTDYLTADLREHLRARGVNPVLPPPPGLDPTKTAGD